MKKIFHKQNILNNKFFSYYIIIFILIYYQYKILFLNKYTIKEETN